MRQVCMSWVFLSLWLCFLSYFHSLSPHFFSTSFASLGSLVGFCSAVFSSCLHFAHFVQPKRICLRQMNNIRSVMTLRIRKKIAKTWHRICKMDLDLKFNFYWVWTQKKDGGQEGIIDYVKWKWVAAGLMEWWIQNWNFLFKVRSVQQCPQLSVKHTEGSVMV